MIYLGANPRKHRWQVGSSSGNRKKLINGVLSSSFHHERVELNPSLDFLETHLRNIPPEGQGSQVIYTPSCLSLVENCFGEGRRWVSPPWPFWLATLLRSEQVVAARETLRQNDECWLPGRLGRTSATSAKHALTGTWFCSIVVSTSALHTEGPGFMPQ